jgi:carotenoid cleavage dioxygenase-like enzyme
MNLPAAAAAAPTQTRDLKRVPLAERSPFRSRAEGGPLALPATVRGTIPAWLSGDLVRTAPAIFDRTDRDTGKRFAAQHWFDALGLLYSFRIANGGVQFQQRLMETEVEKQSRKGQTPAASFGTPIERSFLRRIVSPLPKVTDNTNVNVVPFGNDRVALTETPHQWIVDPDTLAVTKKVVYRDKLGSLNSIAHPHFDFARKRIVSVAAVPGPRNHIVVYECDPSERMRTVVGRVPVGRVPYIHDFGLTPRHAVLVGHPFDFNPLSALWSNAGLVDHFQYRPEEGTKLWLLDRRTGETRTHLAPAGFMFHVVNAYEEGERTVLDVAMYDDASILSRLRRGSMEADELPILAPPIVRYTMTPNQEHAKVETLYAEGFEFPSVDYRKRSGLRHQVAWGARIEQGNAGSTVVRLAANGETKQLSTPEMVFGEPVFVANPASSEEGVGVLLSVGAHVNKEHSELRILDAATLDVIATAEVALPIPLGFHGSFFRN